ncbi:TPA: host specificity protein J, partial [Escherichia coli]|nr:host specificity protein J [Escherichia coli]
RKNASRTRHRWKNLPVIWGPAVSGLSRAIGLSRGWISGFMCAVSTWWASLHLWKPAGRPAMMQKGIWNFSVV